MAAVARARAWLYDLFAHHHAERLRTERAVVRKAHGVAMSDLPYPGSVSSSGNPTTVVQQAGWARGALLGAALLAAGGTAAALGLGALQPGASPPPATAPSAPSPSPPARASAPAWDAITEQRQPDGTWKQVRRERLTVP